MCSEFQQVFMLCLYVMVSHIISFNEIFFLNNGIKKKKLN